MDDDFLEFHDLDWFGVFSDGRVGHFATGGRGFVPEDVRSSISAYEEVYDFFCSLPDLCGNGFVERNLPRFSSCQQRDNYLSSFSGMAKKGIFSYDVGVGGGYNMIAFPSVNLMRAALPERVLALMKLIPFDAVEEIDLGTLMRDC